MPSRIKSTKVGSGITAHTSRRTEYDLTRPLKSEEIGEIKEWFAGLKPRDPIEEASSLALRTLEAIEGGDVSPGDFKPYEGMGGDMDATAQQALRLSEDMAVF